MATSSEDRERARRIRLRAQELAPSEKPRDHDAADDLQLLAALADGVLSLNDVDEETLDRCIQTFGPDSVVDAVLQHHQESSGPQASNGDAVRSSDRPAKRRSRLSRWGMWGFAWAASAAAIVITAVFLWPPHPVHQVNLALQWPSNSPFDPSAFQKWLSPKNRIPTQLPNFNRSVETLGPAEEDRFRPWRLATAIVRLDDGWGSGTFISADGWLLTNYHVVAEAAQEAAISGKPTVVDVILAHIVEGHPKPQPPVKATLYRADPVHDLALLKLEPTNGKPTPFFPFAALARAGEDCFVVGSQNNGPAWWVRGCNLQRPQFAFEYPDDLSQFATGLASAGDSVDRVRTTVIVTDARISGGDSGGPLLNPKGELLGLTFATPQNSTQGSVGWHIALQHLRSFTSVLPKQAESVPFDPWTAGMPEATMLEPEATDSAHSGYIDALRYRYVLSDDGGNPRPVAMTTFIDFGKHLSSAVQVLDRVPRGLWGMETRGQFRFDVFLSTRADGVTAVGYTNAQGIVDEIRIGQSQQIWANVVWNRDDHGIWHATKPTSSKPLVDPLKVGKNNMDRLQAIAGFIVSPVAQTNPNSNPH